MTPTPAKKKTLKERMLSFFGKSRGHEGTRARPRNLATSQPRNVETSSRDLATSRPRAFPQILTDLRKEQSRLSAEVERTLALYDDRTRALAKRLANAGDSRSIDRIRADQEDLWRTVRRLQAALRATRDLEAELKEWALRKEDQEGTTLRGHEVATSCPRALVPSHPDHPVTRIEIVASELRARGRDPFALLQSIRAKAFKGSAEDVDPLHEVEAASSKEAMEAKGLRGCEGARARGLEVAPSRPRNIETSLWRREETEHLLREIADHAREARRMRAHVDSDNLTRELAKTIADYRRYHGYLKMIDRADGMRRDRLGIAAIEI